MTARRSPPRAVRLWRHADRGQLSAGLAGTAVLLVVLAGLLLDPALALAERVRAVDVAQSAARAGADQLDLAELRRTGQVRLDPEQAHAAAAAFLAAAGMTGTVVATTAQVTVTVTGRRPTHLLRLIGIDSLPVQGTGTARPDTGDTP